MVTREMQLNLPELGKGFPVITITGPRQSGKTTLARMAFPGHKYLDLENLTLRQIAREDPASLFADRQGQYILDEFQYEPQVLSHVKSIVDEQQADSQFVLTGSNQFALMKDVAQSLAGRTAILELLPFSSREAYPGKLPPLNKLLFRGLYPRLVSRGMNPGVFYDSYVRTYLQRDIRLLTNIQNMEAFTRFLGLCAGRTGSILNKESLANDAGVDGKTAGNWLSVLQASYVVHLLRPWHGNVSKRLIKSPKLYFHDTGLACNLLGIRDENDLALHPLRGNIFETYALSETLKHYHNRGIRPPLSYYRESNGGEIDLVIDRSGRLFPVEIKSASQVNQRSLGNLAKFGGLGLNTGKGRLVHAGDETWENNRCRCVSWRELAAELELIG